MLIVCLMCLCVVCFPSVVLGVVCYSLASCVWFVFVSSSFLFVCVRACARLFVALCVFCIVSRVCGSFGFAFVLCARLFGC